jgi:cytochrome P450
VSPPAAPPASSEQEVPWGSAELGWPDDPYRAYARARELGPVCPWALRGGHRAWVVTSYADARSALGDPRLSTDGRRFFRSRQRGDRSRAGAFTSTPPEGSELSLFEHMLTTDPPDHTRLRRLVSQAFTLRRVNALRPRITEIAAHLLDGLAGSSSTDLLSTFAFPLPIQVISELLGVPLVDQGRFRSWFTAMLTVGSSEHRRPQARAAAGEVAAYIAHLIALKRAQPADDMISALVAARDGDQVLSETELISMVFLLLLAGHETTVNLIANGVVALLTNRAQLETLLANPDLMPAAVEELLRHDGPVHHPTLRYTTEPLTLRGVDIPAGEVVLVALASANRDPARFPGPDRLDIARPPTQHMAFGHGPHHCLGAPLARLEAQVALSLLLQRFPRLNLAGPLQWREGIFLRGLHSLPIAIE